MEFQVYKPADGACPKHIKIMSSQLALVAASGGVEEYDTMSDNGFIGIDEACDIFGLERKILKRIVQLAGISEDSASGHSFFDEGKLRKAVDEMAPSEDMVIAGQVIKDSFTTQPDYLEAVRLGVIKPVKVLGEYTFYDEHAASTLSHWAQAKGRAKKEAMDAERETRSRREKKKYLDRHVKNPFPPMKLREPRPDCEPQAQCPEGYLPGFTAASRYGVAKATMYKMIRDEKVESMRQGRWNLVKISSLEAFLERVVPRERRLA
jgi:hypothetical protein